MRWQFNNAALVERGACSVIEVAVMAWSCGIMAWAAWSERS